MKDLARYRYHRCDDQRDCWRVAPGRYGLFVITPPGTGFRASAASMITSADSVAPLLHYRGFLKPWLWCYVAKAERWEV